jgi:hypothetical protein
VAVLVAVENAAVDRFSKSIQNQPGNWSEWQDLQSEPFVIEFTGIFGAGCSSCVGE